MRLGARLAFMIVSLALGTAAAADARPMQFSVDGVRLNVTRAFADGIVLGGQHGDATQETTVLDRSGQRALSVIAIPYGTRAGTESDLPVARRGEAAAYRYDLHGFRVRGGEFAMPAPVIDLFGAGISGEVSVRHEDVPGTGAFGRDVLTAEWVSEAGSRIWIVRAVEFAPSGRSFDVMPTFVEGLGQLGVWADGSALETPTTVRKDVLAQGPEPAPTESAGPAARDGAPDQTKPPEYADGCDVANYDAASNQTTWRNYLGASFRGIPACGPRPAVGAPVVNVGFSLGAPPLVVQFESTELALRWLYLVHHTPPYAGNGDRLCANYDAAAGGQPLQQVANYPNGSGSPRPGDVLCYDTGGTGGQTSVVTAAHVDGSGRGWVDVMEQNASAGGFARLPVLDGRVASNYGGYIAGWLTSQRAR
jgi:hypothetical protein